MSSHVPCSSNDGVQELDMSELNPVVSQMPNSGIVVINVRSKELEAEGRDIIHLEQGQPRFETPRAIVKACQDSLLDPRSQAYLPNLGLPECRAAGARYFDWLAPGAVEPTTVSQVLVTPGSVFALNTAMRIVVDPSRDTVLLHDPCWKNYDMAGRFAGADVAYYPLVGQDWSPDVAFLEALLVRNAALPEGERKRYKLLMFTNPGNPTGHICDRGTLERVFEFCVRWGLFMLVDEIYGGVIHPAITPSTAAEAPAEEGLTEETPEAATQFTSMLSLPGAASYPKLMVTNGISKLFSMSGFRVGFLRAHPQIIAEAPKFIEALVSCGSGFSQVAGAFAVNRYIDESIAEEGRSLENGSGAGDGDVVSAGILVQVRRMLTTYADIREALFGTLAKRGELARRLHGHRVGNGGLFSLLWVGDLLGPHRIAADPCSCLCLAVLEETGVAVTPGSFFGDSVREYVRVSYCTQSATVMVTAVERLCDFFAAHTDIRA